ncbi:MAG: hypothetical protein N2508_02940 [Anaerolineae bacterium]|nr:hypothetical protein [Anaerolineae bacterium]
MPDIERPDLEGLPAPVRAYIEALEAELARLKEERRATVQARRERAVTQGEADSLPAEPAEPPTPLSVITISRSGVAKRTPRHLYARQRRGGMGIFDLDTPEEDPPAFLIIADASRSLILLTDQGRAFRISLLELPEAPVRARGTPLLARFGLNQGERLALAFPDLGGLYVALLTRRGYVLWFTGHLFGEKLLPGTVLYDVAKFSPPVSACWCRGDEDLLIATRSGLGIRFAARMVPTRGCLGIRLGRDDEAVAITAVREDDQLFLLGADGRGALRTVSGFHANKAPGASGKVAMKTEQLVGASVVGREDDIFIISRLGKIIRFSAAELLPKEGAVQGVNCISLRGDEAVAVAVSGAGHPGK